MRLRLYFLTKAAHARKTDLKRSVLSLSRQRAPSNTFSSSVRNNLKQSLVTRRMATSITSRNFSINSIDAFRVYEGPPQPQRGYRGAQARRRKVEWPPGSRFIHIDKIVPPDPEPSERTFGGGHLGEYKSPHMTFRFEDILTRLIDNPIVIGSDVDSETETDSDDEAPYGQPPSSQLPILPQLSDELSDDELPNTQDLLLPNLSRGTSVSLGPEATDTASAYAATRKRSLRRFSWSSIAVRSAFRRRWPIAAVMMTIMLTTTIPSRCSPLSVGSAFALHNGPRQSDRDCIFRWITSQHPCGHQRQPRFVSSSQGGHKRYL